MHRRTTPKPRARRAAPNRGVRALGILVVLAVLMGVSGTAWAFWTTAGRGTGTASTGTLAAPSGVSATSPAGSSSVAVSWTAPASGVVPAGYWVERTDTATGSKAAACASSASALLTATSCSDGSVPDGTYSYTVYAVRSGWTAVSAPSATVTVLRIIATSISLTSSPNPSVVGQSVTLTATVTAASGTPTGTVVFRDGGTAITCSGGSQTLSSGTATCVVAWASTGTRNLTATYAGSAPYAASSSAGVSQSVVKRSQTISFTSIAPASATVGGAAYTVTATATSGLAVTFSSTTTGVCTVSGPTVSVSFVAAGTCTIAADQAGDATYAAAVRVTQSFTVSKSAQSITFTSSAPASAMLGDAPYAVAASASSGLVVTFTSATPSVCTVSGTSVSYVAAGTCSVNADQAGNATWAAAPQATQSFLVTPTPTAPTGLAVDASGNSGTATWTSVPGYTYECQITNGSSPPGTSSWAPCTAPFMIPPGNGKQTVYVRALRGAVVSTPASQSFK